MNLEEIKQELIKSNSYKSHTLEYKHLESTSLNDIESTLDAQSKEIDREIRESIKLEKKKTEKKFKEEEMYWTHKDSLTNEEKMYLDKEAESFLEDLKC